jgi:hypothetical protein
LKMIVCMGLSLLFQFNLALFLCNKELPFPRHKELLFLRVFLRHKKLSFPRHKVLLFLRCKLKMLL